MSNRNCYYIIESRMNDAGNALVAIVKENEAGYYVTDNDWGDVETAKRIADDLNSEMGITPREAAEIVATSMVAQKRESGRIR